MWKSILENVALRVEGAKEEIVEEVCSAALFHEIVRDLTDGYETILGGGGSAGVALSGGQKQRLLRGRGLGVRAYLSSVSFPSYFMFFYLLKTSNTSSSSL
jgi:ABC-type protease/lipase transport system fused ATPase/permease subunit